jgi:antirestriction protein ArdC
MSNAATKTTKASVYDIITARILAALQAGTVPWRQTWTERRSAARPRNFVTGKAYRGVNVLILWAAGFSSPDFLTFNQAKKLGGSVRKGERGIPVVFWRVYDGKDVNPKTGKAEKRFVLRYYTVFNVTQCEGLEAPQSEEPTTRTVDPIETCEAIVAGYANPPAVRHGGARAFYAPASDLVAMPDRDAFEGAEEYYSTLFHEFGHSTGAAHRLNRKGVAQINAFGSHDYSFEELVAECTAAFLCAEAGISPATIENSAAYIANWSRKLQSEPRWIIEAAAQASKAADLILGRDPNGASSEDDEES